MIRCMTKSVQQNGVYLVGRYEGAYYNVLCMNTFEGEVTLLCNRKM